MQKTSILLMAFTLSACSSLDSNSNFTDAVDTVRDRKNYVEVVAKDYSPDFEAISGPNIMKSSLVLNANFAKSEGSVPESFIAFEVSYFQNYDEYKTVSFNNVEYGLNTLQTTVNSCNEHCTTTQYVSFPVDTELVREAAEDGLDFTLTSSGKGLVTSFEVPAGYFKAVVEEADVYLSGVSSPAVAAVPVATVSQMETVEASKPLEMMEYWYEESSELVKGQFEDWAFSNRKGDVGAFETTEQSGQMLEYWFKKSSESERKQIIKWLLEQ